jgi:hypothetical protein
MGHFMEKIATNFFAHTPPPKFFELFNNQIFIPSPIGTFPATSSFRANHTPYGIQVSCQPYPVWFQTSHIWHGICSLHFPCQPYSIWHEHPKGWHGICFLHFPCQSRTIQNHMVYGWHNYCFSAFPMPIQNNPPQPNSPPDRQESHMHGSNI